MEIIDLTNVNWLLWANGSQEGSGQIPVPPGMSERHICILHLDLVLN